MTLEYWGEEKFAEGVDLHHPPTRPWHQPLLLEHPITIQDSGIKKLVYQAFSSKIMPGNFFSITTYTSTLLSNTIEYDSLCLWMAIIIFSKESITVPHTILLKIQLKIQTVLRVAKGGGGGG